MWPPCSIGFPQNWGRGGERGKDAMSITKEPGQSEQDALYEVPDNELAIGSTLGGPKAACIIKATGAIQLIYSIDIGQVLFGTGAAAPLRRRDGDAPDPRTAGDVHHPPGASGTQVHAAEPGERPRDHFCAQRRTRRYDGTVDPPGVYYAVELHNTGDEPAKMQTNAYADLRGQTGHDMVAEYDAYLNALVAWNASEPDWVRAFGCSEPPDSYETTPGSRQGGRRRRPRRAVEQDGRPDRPAGRIPPQRAPSRPVRRRGSSTS